jgi:hypothetical protein
MALLGGLIGVAVAALSLDQARGFIPSFGPLLSFGLPVPVMAAGLGVAVAVGLSAGTLPAIRSIHSSVLDGLRRVA